MLFPGHLPLHAQVLLRLVLGSLQIILLLLHCLHPVQLQEREWLGNVGGKGGGQGGLSHSWGIVINSLQKLNTVESLVKDTFVLMTFCCVHTRVIKYNEFLIVGSAKLLQVL